MDPKRTLSITEARKRIFEIIDEVQKPDTHYTLTEKGRPKAEILSVEKFDSRYRGVRPSNKKFQMKPQNLCCSFSVLKIAVKPSYELVL